jgi:hypothetical protein
LTAQGSELLRWLASDAARLVLNLREFFEK